MSSAKSLVVSERSIVGTGPARACRREGNVPGVIYGGAHAPVSVFVVEKEIMKEMSLDGFLSHVYVVEISGKKEKVLVRSVQFHPVTDRPISIDFMRVSKESKLTVDVPLHFINEGRCAAIKQGGVMNALRHTLPLICSPESIPEFIEIDLAPLHIGSSVSVNDLPIPSNVQISHPEKIGTILTIVPPKVGSAEEKAEEKTE